VCACVRACVRVRVCVCVCSVSACVISNHIYIHSDLDPRPQMGLSSNSVYIGENYSANKLIAWVKVEAKNVKTNQLAKVKFTIVEGNFICLHN